MLAKIINLQVIFHFGATVQKREIPIHSNSNINEFGIS